MGGGIKFTIAKMLAKALLSKERKDAMCIGVWLSACPDNCATCEYDATVGVAKVVCSANGCATGYGNTKANECAGMFYMCKNGVINDIM